MLQTINKWAGRIIAGAWTLALLLLAFLAPFAACIALWQYIFKR